jgi:mono/diheme cytochrome c family protein
MGAGERLSESIAQSAIGMMLPFGSNLVFSSLARPSGPIRDAVYVYFLTHARAGGTEEPSGKPKCPGPAIGGWFRIFLLVDLERPMPRPRDLVVALACILGLAMVHSLRSEPLLAQNAPATAPSGAAKLTEQETRGEGLFRQRCSLCHLPRKLKFGSPAVVGPDLTGLFKEAGPDKQKLLRGTILKGGPEMPGFQYGLEPKEVDDLIAYLKTL